MTVMMMMMMMMMFSFQIIRQQQSRVRRSRDYRPTRVTHDPAATVPHAMQCIWQRDCCEKPKFHGSRFLVASP